MSSVNIPPGADYSAIDKTAIALAETAGAAAITSVETTHAIIRAQAEVPFLFLSGIANRVGHFADENNGGYVQNFTAAHNAAIVATFVIPQFAAALPFKT